MMNMTKHMLEKQYLFPMALTFCKFPSKYIFQFNKHLLGACILYHFIAIYYIK